MLYANLMLEMWSTFEIIMFATVAVCLLASVALVVDGPK